MSPDINSSSAAEVAVASQWGQRHLLEPHGPVPFSCRLNGEPLNLDDGAWQVTRTDNLLEAYHAGFGLHLRCRSRAYSDFAAVEWTVELQQTAQGQPPLISELLGVDCRWQSAEKHGFAVRGINGDTHERRDLYAPWIRRLSAGMNWSSGQPAPRGFSIAPTWGSDLVATGDDLATGAVATEKPEGRPCSGAFPFFAIEELADAAALESPPVGGFLLAIGWPGRWRAEFACERAGQIRVRAGQEGTAFRLQPGETVRTPLIALLFFQGGDRIRVQNLWRRWMLAHNLPRLAGQLPPPMLEGSNFPFLEEMTKADEANQFDLINRYHQAALPIDCWWMDAGWYPCWVEARGKNCWGQTGTWESDLKRFPRGIRAVSDHAHKLGIKSLLWFEPERVAPGTWLHDQRPEWLLLARDQKIFKAGELPELWQDLWHGARLFDLGNDDARAWLLDRLSTLVEREGIDVYRQDFNLNPLAYWRDNDSPERAGMTENRYVTGYLKLWDALRQRFPRMLIDSCASGGRRNDLETLRRGVALHPTDYRYDDLPVKQAIRHSLFQWIPYFGGPVMPFDRVDTYAFRSSMGLSTVVVFDLRRDDVDLDLLRNLMTEWHAVKDCFYGDYYPLTPYSRNEESWIGWQFHRPDTGEGLIQMFRRAESPVEVASFQLRGLDADATYIVHDFDTGEEHRSTGRDLATGWRLEIPQRRSARLFRYHVGK